MFLRFARFTIKNQESYPEKNGGNWSLIACTRLMRLLTSAASYKFVLNLKFNKLTKDVRQQLA